MNRIIFSLLICLPGLSGWQCASRPDQVPIPLAFTRADSLTDCYLTLEDSVLKAWHLLIKNDNQKIALLQSLVHELSLTNPDDEEQFESFETRIGQLERIRYNQRTIENSNIVDEYDFASRSLINEVLGLARSKPEFTYNVTLQQLSSKIEISDRQTLELRNSYDKIVTEYNSFLERNTVELSELQDPKTLLKKPVFQASIAE